MRITIKIINSQAVSNFCLAVCLFFKRFYLKNNQSHVGYFYCLPRLVTPPRPAFSPSINSSSLSQGGKKGLQFIYYLFLSFCFFCKFPSLMSCALCSLQSPANKHEVVRSRTASDSERRLQYFQTQVKRRSASKKAGGRRGCYFCLPPQQKEEEEERRHCITSQDESGGSEQVYI